MLLVNKYGIKCLFLFIIKEIYIEIILKCNVLKLKIKNDGMV